jgi:two-component system, OmpR family, sensor histidine kinase KdpD
LLWGEVMQLVKAALPIAAALAIISAVTAVLCAVRAEEVGPQHLVFFYLLPTALVAVLYGSLPAMLGAIAATICAAYFLYDPLYSFSVANPLELGELFCFAGLALIGAKCTADLLRPPPANLSEETPATED